MSGEIDQFIELPTSSHYVDNKKFLQALIDYKVLVDEARKLNRSPPQVPNYIGECFIKIATHLSYKSNFINYTFKDDMISDGIENCLTAVEKFDSSKSTNPFAYYTQIVYFAFIRRIQKEKKQQVTKYRRMESIDIDQIITQESDNKEISIQFLEYIKRQLDQVDIDKRLLNLSKKNKFIEDNYRNNIDNDE
jgi:DNA-directed RNA polymerase specialized sigma subunit